MKTREMAWVIAFVVFSCITAQAGINGTGGAVVLVASPPADITAQNWESNTDIRAFAERTALTLPQSISVDRHTPGTSPNAINQNLDPAVIPAGTVVNSYFLHFDVAGTPVALSSLQATGSISFSEPVLGVIALAETLNDTTSILGLPTITYSGGPAHGLELDPFGEPLAVNDHFTLQADAHTVTVNLHDGPNIDELRIVTAVPEPLLVPTAALFAMAMLSRRRGATYNRVHVSSRRD